MKKTISIITSLIILILSFSICAYAQEPVILSIQDEKVYAGDTFTVNVFISDNSMVSGAIIDINYDKEKLEFISAKEGGILDTKANTSIRNIKNDKTYVRFAYMSGSSSIDAEGILFTVTFKALETAKGKTNLEITIPNPADFVNSDLEKLAYSVDNSEITILDNISIETTTEQPATESTSVPETTDVVPSDSTTNNDIVQNDNNNDDKDIMIMVVLVLIGIALICFGIVVANKKKK